MSKFVLTCTCGNQEFKEGEGLLECESCGKNIISTGDLFKAIIEEVAEENKRAAANARVIDLSKYELEEE